jgi:hypothetical protein
LPILLITTAQPDDETASTSMAAGSSRSTDLRHLIMSVPNGSPETRRTRSRD